MVPLVIKRGSGDATQLYHVFVCALSADAAAAGLLRDDCAPRRFALDDVLFEDDDAGGGGGGGGGGADDGDSDGC